MLRKQLLAAAAGGSLAGLGGTGASVDVEAEREKLRAELEKDREKEVARIREVSDQ